MIFTVGHSNRDMAEFLELVRGIDTIIDVRSHPTSRYAHFRQEQLQQWLPEHGACYEWVPGLGGWTDVHLPYWSSVMTPHGVDVSAYAGAFPKQRIGKSRPADDGPTWTNQGLYDYAWYMTTPDFLQQARKLMALYGDSETKVAIMCAEALWWKCHRSMIADYLVWSDCWVAHLPPSPPKRTTTRRFTVHAGVIGNRLERYPAGVLAKWVT